MLAFTTTLVRMRFGSHLYGTVTEDSDTDYKGVFLPGWSQILLSQIPKTVSHKTKRGKGKNTATDIDREAYSLHYFLKLACQGQTVALDMLHAPEEMCEVYHPVWRELVGRRSEFYTKNLDAFVGYARRQAAKYGIRGSRLQEAQAVYEILLSHVGWREASRLEDVWELLPRSEHVHDVEPDPKGVAQIQVCGRKYSARTPIEGAAHSIGRYVQAYGERARLAAENKGIDWKAVSHAIRAACQVREILTAGTITFPRPEADFLRGIKMGQFDYQTEAGPKLEELMAEVEALAAASTLPEKVDRKTWEQWLLGVMDGHMRRFYSEEVI